MKALLRLMGKVCPEKQRSAGRCQQSAMSYQLSVVSHQLPAKSWLTPKIYYLIPFLILVFVSCGAALAQESVGHTAPAAKAESEITPLKIGDKIPDELWNLPLQVVNHPEGKETITLNDYRGKLIILDFWATWCGACISTFPKIENLKEKLGEHVQFLPVSYEGTSVMSEFISKRTEIENKKSFFFSIVEDSVLRQTFKHRLIPHYVWINTKGIVELFSGNDALTSINLFKALKNDNVDIEIKNDLNVNVPLFMIDGFQGKELSYYSILRKGIYPGLPSGNQYTREGKVLRGRAMTNTQLKTIYKIIAYELFKRNGEQYFSNRKRIGPGVAELLEDYFNYELIVPKENATNLYKYMLDNLNCYGELNAGIEKENTECYILAFDKKPVKQRELSIESGTTSSEVSPNLQFKTVNSLVEFLNETSLIDLPVIDETGIEFPINVILSEEEIKKSLFLILRQHGFALNKANRDILVLSIERK